MTLTHAAILSTLLLAVFGLQQLGEHAASTATQDPSTFMCFTAQGQPTSSDDWKSCETVTYQRKDRAS